MKLINKVSAMKRADYLDKMTPEEAESLPEDYQAHLPDKGKSDQDKTPHKDCLNNSDGGDQ